MANFLISYHRYEDSEDDTLPSEEDSEVDDGNEVDDDEEEEEENATTGKRDETKHNSPSQFYLHWYREQFRLTNFNFRNKITTRSTIR